MERVIRNLLLVCICVHIFACGKAPQPVAPAVEQKYALETLIDSCLAEYPSANNNDVSRSIFADTLKSKFQNYRNEHLPYIADLPFQYEICLEYPPKVFETVVTERDKYAGMYVVKFSFREIISNCQLSEDYSTTMQVFAVLSKEIVATLVDGAMYNIDGIFRDFANNSQETGFILPSGKCLVDYPKATNYDNKLSINLGTLVFDSLSFSRIESK
ncbi:MAG: hypothetical protein IKV33_04115 [Alistipes sp.]|nr:hypothetical protein [Alistipes sp.]